MKWRPQTTYSPAATQQGLIQTTQACGKPTDVSYTQAQTTATYGQTAYVTSSRQPPTGSTTPTVPQA